MSKPEGHEHDVRAAVAGAEAGRPGDFSTGAGAGRGGASRAEQTLADVRCAVRGRCRGILRYCVICNYICPGLKVLAPWAGLLFLRLLIGWEFLDSGLEKWGGENWFADIQSDFPFPFNHLPAELNWQLAMWFEIVGGVALMLGLATRFFAFALLVVTWVATVAVHWPADWHSLAELWQGYVITDEGHGNFKLPLLFAVMLWALLFQGGGRLSLDALIGWLWCRRR